MSLWYTLRLSHRLSPQHEYSWGPDPASYGLWNLTSELPPAAASANLTLLCGKRDGAHTVPRPKAAGNESAARGSEM